MTHDEEEQALQSFRIMSRLPWAVVVAILMQAAGGVWYAGQLKEEITTLQNNYSSLAAYREQQGTQLNSINQTLARMDERLSFVIERLGYQTNKPHESMPLLNEGQR